jgi:type IV pilus assembly protein PilM
MSLAGFYKIFPVPKYLELSLAGIDISDASVKYAELDHSTNGYRLKKFGEVPLPPGTVDSGHILDRERLAEVLREIKKKTGFRLVHISLPEEESFVVRMKVPWESPEQLPDSIELGLEEYIPLPADQVTFDFEIYDKPASETGEYSLGVYVAPKALVADYSETLKLAGLVPVGLEIEVQSAARALVAPTDEGTYLVADLGRTRTSFFIVSRGKVMFTSTIKSVGGDNLTKAIERAMGVSFEEAEQLKKKSGLLNSEDNHAVFEAMIPVSSVFKDETKRHFGYWEGLRENGETTDPISKLIFCGGQATLPGLAEYISSGLPVKVEIGNVWSSLETKKLPPLPFNDSIRYVAAIGLALRGAISTNQ